MSAWFLAFGHSRAAKAGESTPWGEYGDGSIGTPSGPDKGFLRSGRRTNNRSDSPMPEVMIATTYWAFPTGLHLPTSFRLLIHVLPNGSAASRLSLGGDGRTSGERSRRLNR